jgi:CBS domain containing-hemolysin-like protein
LFGLKKKSKKSDANISESDEAQKEILEEERNGMIHGVEELAVTTVKEVMVPRIDVDFISLETAEDELLQKVTESGHSRIPVYSGSIDNVVGILYVKDLIKALAKKEPVDLEKIIRKPYFVPESKRIDSLLREFKRRHVHIAISIDEYGGISGIVCMEDIIEEIVGDIQDEFDNEREDIIALSENVWICDARVDLDTLNEEIGAEFPAENFDTLGGFVFDLFGKIPVKFEKVSWGSYDFIIQEMEGHKVNAIKLMRKKDE